MSLNRHKLAIGVLAALMHQSGWAQPAATASLLEQGRYWQNQGDAKRAAQAWEKLLLSDPSQQEAMYGLGLAAVLLVSVAYLVDSTYNPFIYFRF